MQHANEIFALEHTLLSFPNYNQEIQLYYFQCWWSGEDDTVLKGKWIQGWLAISAIPLTNVCLLLGC